MKRPIVTLGLVGLLAFPVASACNQATTPGDDEGGNAGSTSSSAGSGGLVIPTAGSTGQPTAGSTGVTPTAGSGTGGSPAATAGTSAGGAAGTATAGAGGSGGGAGSGAGGTAGAGTNPGCPVKIDSQVPCTQVVVCPNAYCGVFQMGAKNCECAAASGNFTCTSCDYTGRTEEIVQPPAAVLPACAADDMTLEKSTPNCTVGMRCKSLTADKNRFCACWNDPVDGAAKWDCDSQPAAWPK